MLGLPWARSIDVMTRSLRHLPAIDVVQLSGAMEVPGVNSSAVDIVRRAAQVTGGSSSIFHAPLLLDDDVAASSIRRDGLVARGLAQAARVTTAVMGIGSWAPGLSTIYDAVSPADREDCLAAGVVGEIAGRFFDAEGRLIEPPLSGRIVTIGAEELRAIPEVIGIVSGRPKSAAVRRSPARWPGQHARRRRRARRRPAGLRRRFRRVCWLTSGTVAPRSCPGRDSVPPKIAPRWCPRSETVVANRTAYG